MTRTPSPLGFRLLGNVRQRAYRKGTRSRSKSPRVAVDERRSKRRRLSSHESSETPLNASPPRSLTRSSSRAGKSESRSVPGDNAESSKPSKASQNPTKSVRKTGLVCVKCGSKLASRWYFTSDPSKTQCLKCYRRLHRLKMKQKAKGLLNAAQAHDKPEEESAQETEPRAVQLESVSALPISVRRHTSFSNWGDLTFDAAKLSLIKKFNPDLAWELFSALNSTSVAANRGSLFSHLSPSPSTKLIRNAVTVLLSALECNNLPILSAAIRALAPEWKVMSQTLWQATSFLLKQNGSHSLLQRLHQFAARQGASKPMKEAAKLEYICSLHPTKQLPSEIKRLKLTATSKKLIDMVNWIAAAIGSTGECARYFNESGDVNTKAGTLLIQAMLEQGDVETCKSLQDAMLLNSVDKLTNQIEENENSLKPEEGSSLDDDSSRPSAEHFVHQALEDCVQTNGIDSHGSACMDEGTAPMPNQAWLGSQMNCFDIITSSRRILATTFASLESRIRALKQLASHDPWDPLVEATLDELQNDEAVDPGIVCEIAACIIDSRPFDSKISWKVLANFLNGCSLERLTALCQGRHWWLPVYFGQSMQQAVQDVCCVTAEHDGYAASPKNGLKQPVLSMDNLLTSLIDLGYRIQVARKWLFTPFEGYDTFKKWNEQVKWYFSNYSAAREIVQRLANLSLGPGFQESNNDSDTEFGTVAKNNDSNTTGIRLFVPPSEHQVASRPSSQHALDSSFVSLAGQDSDIEVQSLHQND